MLAVVLNPASGRLREGLKPGLEELFRDHDIDVSIREVSTPHEVSVLARTALSGSVDAVIAAGGDGTVNAVASALAGGSIPLGVLPLGTLNHFAKDLNIPLDLPKAVQTIADGHVRRVDVGRLGDSIFLNNSSIGVYPSIIERRERLRRLGHSKWVAFARATIEVLRRGDEVSLRLESHSTKIAARTPFLFVGNNEYRGEGLHLGARVRLDGGRLYAYFAPPVHTRDLPKLFARALLGHVRQDRTLQSFSAAEFWVDTPLSRQLKVACDGELLTVTTPLHFRIWPAALNVFAPIA